MALFGALAYLIPPLALNKITDYMDTYDEETAEGGVPLVVVVSVAGLFIGQVTYPDRFSHTIYMVMSLVKVHRPCFCQGTVADLLFLLFFFYLLPRTVIFFLPQNFVKSLSIGIFHTTHDRKYDSKRLRSGENEKKLHDFTGVNFTEID